VKGKKLGRTGKISELKLLNSLGEGKPLNGEELELSNRKKPSKRKKSVGKHWH